MSAIGFKIKPIRHISTLMKGVEDETYFRNKL